MPEPELLARAQRAEAAALSMTLFAARLMALDAFFASRKQRADRRFRRAVLPLVIVQGTVTIVLGLSLPIALVVALAVGWIFGRWSTEPYREPMPAWMDDHASAPPAEFLPEFMVALLP